MFRQAFDTYARACHRPSRADRSRARSCSPCVVPSALTKTCHFVRLTLQAQSGLVCTRSASVTSVSVSRRRPYQASKACALYLGLSSRPSKARGLGAVSCRLQRSLPAAARAVHHPLATAAVACCCWDSARFRLRPRRSGHSSKPFESLRTTTRERVRAFTADPLVTGTRRNGQAEEDPQICRSQTHSQPQKRSAVRSCRGAELQALKLRACQCVWADDKLVQARKKANAARRSASSTRVSP